MLNDESKKVKKKTISICVNFLNSWLGSLDRKHLIWRKNMKSNFQSIKYWTMSLKKKNNFNCIKGFKIKKIAIKKNKNQNWNTK
jgi:hypothetical protein